MSKNVQVFGLLFVESWAILYTFPKFLKLNILCFIDSEVVTLLLLLSLKSVLTVIQDGAGWSGVIQSESVEFAQLYILLLYKVSCFWLEMTVALVSNGRMWCGVS